MAATCILLVLLVLLPSTVTTTKVYYVIANDEQLSRCPYYSTCHKLSYYISSSEYYFTYDTTFIFLEGQHSFDISDHVQVSNVHNLTLRGQGEWPVEGPEETVMQSNVTINCTEGRGGFHFFNSQNIIVEGLTIVNCGNQAVFDFSDVQQLTFQKNSIQNMTGYGLRVVNCKYVAITNCSYYRSVLCNASYNSSWYQLGGGVGIVYNGSTQYSTLELSYSNMTNCCSSFYGGGIYLDNRHGLRPATIYLSHLTFLHNKACYGAGMAMLLGRQTMVNVSNCTFSKGQAHSFGGGIYLNGSINAKVFIENSHFLENSGRLVSEIRLQCSMLNCINFTLFLLNSVVHHTISISNHGVVIAGNSATAQVVGTKMTFANIRVAGLVINCYGLWMNNSQIVNSHNVHIVFRLSHSGWNFFTNCTFSNNTGGRAVISIYEPQDCFTNIFINCTVSDNSMSGISLFGTAAKFVGRNVIQNNHYTYGAGIILSQPSFIAVDGELIIRNNIADKHGGGILVKQTVLSIQNYVIPSCSLRFIGNYSLIFFSGNRAGQGGGDMYNAQLMGCNCLGLRRIRYPFLAPHYQFVSHVGQPNETSWYFSNRFMNYIYFNDTDRISSMSSDPVMVCFCNSSNLPDCSDRVKHMQTYPGLEINTTIATVGNYGGTSPGDVQVSAEHARLVRYYGQKKTTKCFQLHILLQNSSSTTALVDMRVNVEQGLNLSMKVDIIACPIGFIDISGECHCDHILANGKVQCNVSMTPYRFLRSGNSWFGYINNTQCVTGTTNCPFDYCNRYTVSFDIMAPDLQCLGNRTGVLCGQCQSHLNIMLGSNRCGTCSNWYLFLIPTFALAGIVLVVVLMFFNLSVSVGTINGLLFYANMVKLNEAFFFPNGNIPVVSHFISWLNLDLGIEVCLFDGLDGYLRAWLQFAFPAYLYLLMFIIIVGCHYSTRLCRLCGSHAVPALATLFLMSYSKLLLTITDALSMSQLPCNGSVLTVWSVDGNIEYGSTKHIILVVFSSGILVIGLVYPVLVLCAPLLERYSDKCIPQHRWNPVTQFKPLFDAYGGPYKDKYRFWTGMTLMVRLVVTIAFSFTSGNLMNINALITATFVTGILTFWAFSNGVYKNTYLGFLEIFYLLNLFLLSIVSLAIVSQDYQISTIVSVCLSFLVFLATIVVHLLQKFDLKSIKRRLGFKNRLECMSMPRVAVDGDDADVSLFSPPSVVYGRQRGEHQFVLEFRCSSQDGQEQESLSPVLLDREPLLFDTNLNTMAI